MSVALLPDCRARDPKSRVMWANGMAWVAVHCANCGALGGYVPEENMTFAFYLCNPCTEKWSPQADQLAVPDEIFFQLVKEEQLEKYGRELTTPELLVVLADENSSLSKLARDRPQLTGR